MPTNNNELFFKWFAEKADKDEASYATGWLQLLRNRDDWAALGLVIRTNLQAHIKKFTLETGNELVVVDPTETTKLLIEHLRNRFFPEEDMVVQ
jgi:hypothetical protein